MKKIIFIIFSTITLNLFSELIKTPIDIPNQNDLAMYDSPEEAEKNDAKIRKQRLQEQEDKEKKDQILLTQGRTTNRRSIVPNLSEKNEEEMVEIGKLKATKEKTWWQKFTDKFPLFKKSAWRKAQNTLEKNSEELKTLESEFIKGDGPNERNILANLIKKNLRIEENNKLGQKLK
ncbi:hypothetical protein HYV11_03655 [Candidatus Dependentiae bacterium]|nr:hypothetical protein [Candidatus Dependentiae bacterium]